MEGFAAGNVATPIFIEKREPAVVLRARRSWSGPFEPVYVKVLPVNGRCIEAVCAWLAREIGLPAPEPLLLTMPANKMPRGSEWPFGTQSRQVCFATRAIPGALALRRVASDQVGGMLDRWPHLAAAAAFDSLIANDDRTEGNILLDPARALWLIDHARSLGGGGERLFSTDVTPTAPTYFLSRIAGYAVPERVRLRTALIAVCTKLCAAVPRIPYDTLLVPENIAMQIEDFLVRRAHVLQAMVLQAIGVPDLYSEGNHPESLQ
ncbi:MAG: hypothetical protein HZC37_13535 [Burkholderiales bacterium]|nr:hypothetical protein [Burkholderiales bacterium]